MRVKVELSQQESNLILHALADQYNKIARSKAKHWRPSTRAMALSDINRLRNKIVGEELKQKQWDEVTDD